MKKFNNIILYLLGFIILAYLLKLIGLVSFNNYELLAVVFAAYGSGTVYNSMGKNKKFGLFVGTAAFQAGVVFLLIGREQIPNTSGVIFPALLFILGIGCFMLFWDNTSDKTLLLISVIFILLGIVYTAVSGSFNISTFMNSLAGVIPEFWLLILVVIIVIYAVAKSGKNKE